MARKDLYTGKAGQMATMSEFLIRGWNVALPEVDVGDDIFVVRDRDGEFHRIQVKTASARGKKRYSAIFNFQLPQLRTPSQPDLTFVLATRRKEEEAWTDFIVIPRRRLFELHQIENLGSVQNGRLVLSIRFPEVGARCGGIDLSDYHNDWSRFPVVRH